jgi:hypothetical protein
MMLGEDATVLWLLEKVTVRDTREGVVLYQRNQIRSPLK